MNWKMWTAGGGLVVAAGLVLAMPTEAADPETPTCAADEALVWAPHGQVDPQRKKACQA
jgi:hypothetical protein